MTYRFDFLQGCDFVLKIATDNRGTRSGKESIVCPKQQDAKTVFVQYSKWTENFEMMSFSHLQFLT